MAHLVTVEGVSKRYGGHQALEALSFTAEKGEVIALLGRNGAGKSTLMNILTGYVAMTTGRALIAGFDVQRQALDARRHVGYLPEQPPLYPDMTVTEYLTYCARLKGIAPKRARAEIAETIDRLGLRDYRRRLAGQLSKGYRQRLGLAQALLGEPELLILDEPGSGLDPLQMAELRTVICGARQHSAVLLSSHILSEVTSVCSRAIVLDQGRRLYDGGMNELLRDDHRLTVAWRGGDGVMTALNAMRGVRVEDGLLLPDGTACAKLFLEDEDARGAVVRAVLDGGGELRELIPGRATLESAFMHLIHDQEVAE